MSEPENIPAFPSVCLGDPSHPMSAPGMTLRDWFAGQAITAIVAVTSAGQHQPIMHEGEIHIRTAMARDAYELADAMLAARGAA